MVGNLENKNYVIFVVGSWTTPDSTQGLILALSTIVVFGGCIWDIKVRIQFCMCKANALTTVL